MKRRKILAVTHSGMFHADEVMASVILKQFYDEVEIKRSRNSEDFEEADIVFDVGGGQFDHHSDEKEYREDGVPYAACGLIWRAFGPKIIKRKAPTLTEDQIDEVFFSIDESLIESIDAVDNGFNIEKRDINMPTINHLVKGFNPNWNSNLVPDEQFVKAIDFCTPILLNALESSISAIEAEEVVRDAIYNRSNEKILILDQFCPWKRHLTNYDQGGTINYVIFKDRNNSYIIQAVPEHNSMESKKPFPAEWAGKKPEEINELVDIDDAIFVHAARFIAGVESLDSAIKMAEVSLSK